MSSTPTVRPWASHRHDRHEAADDGVARYLRGLRDSTREAERAYHRARELAADLAVALGCDLLDADANLELAEVSSTTIAHQGASTLQAIIDQSVRVCAARRLYLARSVRQAVAEQAEAHGRPSSVARWAWVVGRRAGTPGGVRAEQPEEELWRD